MKNPLLSSRGIPGMRRKMGAVVIGIGSYNDLGVIRSCGEAGVGSVYVTPRRELVFPIQKSRYVVEWRRIDFTEEAIVNEIVRIGRGSDADVVVFPTADVPACIIDRNCGVFPPNVKVSGAGGRMPQLMDKSVMASSAKAAGLNVPETVVLENSGDVPGREWRYPLIVKPVRSIDGEKSDIRICRDCGELTAAVKEYEGKGYSQMLVQQYLCAPDKKEIGITGIVFPDGRVEIHGYIDKIRNLMNINNFGVYHPNDEELGYDSLKKYVLSTGYTGIFDTDFIVNQGVLYFIECNFRNGAYGYCTTAAGFNMPACWATDGAEGLKPQLKDVVFMEERTDLLNVLNGDMPLLKWLKDVLRTDTFLFWNRRDPAPYFRIPAGVRQKFAALSADLGGRVNSLKIRLKEAFKADRGGY